MRLIRAAALFVAACVFAPAIGQTQDLGSSRRVQGTAEVTSVEVGDVPGHVVGVVQFKGLTFFESGEIATHANPATFDLTDGSGPHRGYVVHYFDDGSTSIERYEGEARLSADGKRTVVEGTFACIGGNRPLRRATGRRHLSGRAPGRPADRRLRLRRHDRQLHRAVSGRASPGQSAAKQ